jgi:tellurite resistance protein
VESDLSSEGLSIFEKRRAAEAVVDAAVISHIARGSFKITEETRERWVQLVMEQPELTEELFSSSMFSFRF